jgi:hypothetical protein
MTIRPTRRCGFGKINFDQMFQQRETSETANAAPLMNTATTLPFIAGLSDLNST